MKNIYEYSFNTIEGNKVNLSNFKGKYILIFNSASSCGLTPQLPGLQNIDDSFDDLVVIAFPCSQFKNQEFSTKEEIVKYYREDNNYKFIISDKVNVNGEEEDELFKYLKENKKGVLGKKVVWNFAKFLIDKEGNIIKRYSPTTTPEKIIKDIKKLK